MSAEHEQEKLTPASRKGYDGSMSMSGESSNEEHIGEPEKENDEEQAAKGSEAGSESTKNEESSVESDESTSKLVKILHAMFATAYRTGNEREKAAFGEAILRSLTSENPHADESHEDWKSREKTAGEKKQAALLLFNLITPEKLDAHSSEQEVENSNVADAVFDELLKVAADANFDKDELTQTIAEIAEDKPLIEEHDRFDALDEFFKEQLETNDEKNDQVLAMLQQELKDLKELTEAGSLLHEDAGKAESVIDAILNDVEVHTDTNEQRDLDEGFYEKYADMLERVMQALPDVQEKEKVEREQVRLTESEKQELQLMMNVLLAPTDVTNAEKRVTAEKIIANMLRDRLSLLGSEDPARNEAIREEIFNLAKAAGLDATAIEVFEVAGEIDVEKVNALEEVPTENTFESLIAQQIVDASIDDVKNIQAAWQELLKKAKPGTPVYEDAVNALDILNDVLEFKIEQKRAREEDRSMDPSLVAAPRSHEEDDEDDEEKELRDDKEAKNSLIAFFASFITTKDPQLNAVHKKIFEHEISLLIVTAKNYDEQLARVSKLLSVLPKTTHGAFVEGEIRTLALVHGIDPETQKRRQLEISDEQRVKQLQALFKESLSGNAVKPLREMKESWKALLTDKSISDETRSLVQDALENIEKLVPTKTTMSRDEAMETMATQTIEHGDLLSGLFIEQNALPKGHEAELVKALVHTRLAPHRLENGTYEHVLAERALAQLLVLFPGEGQHGISTKTSNAIRLLILKEADALELEDRLILHEVTKLTEKRRNGDVLTTQARKKQLDKLIRDSLVKADKKQVEDALAVWEEMNVDETDDFHTTAQNARASLNRLADAKGSIETSDSAASDPTVLFEQKKPQKTQETKEDPAIVETRAKITALEESLAAVEDEEFQGYFKDLQLPEILDRMKQGMTKQEAVAESRALLKRMVEVRKAITGDSRKRDEKNARDMEKFTEMNKIIKPITTFLLQAEDGIPAIEKPAEPKDVFVRKTAFDEMKTLIEGITGFAAIEGADNAALNEYLQGLPERFAAMKPEEIRQEIEELNARTVAYIEEAREIVDKKSKDKVMNERSVNIAGEKFITFEYSVNQLRKFLEGEISADARKEDAATVELGADERDLVSKFVTRTQKVIDEKDYDKVTVKSLETYIERLTKVLEIPHALTPEQVEDAYRALNLQDGILRNRAEKDGRLFEYSEQFTKVSLAKAKLYGALSQVYKDGIQAKEKEIEESTKEKIYSYIEDIGHVVSVGDSGMRMPIISKVADPSSRGLVPVKETLENTLDPMVQAGSAFISAPRTGQLNPQEQELEQNIRDLGTVKDIYAKEERLKQMEDQLQAMISEAIRTNSGDGLVSLQNLGPARELVRRMNAQRNEIAKMRGYEGLILEREKMDPELYDGHVHQVLRERLKRLKSDLETAGASKYTTQELVNYYTEIQRWTSILLNNDYRRNAKARNDPDVLKLKNKRFEEFEKIEKTDITVDNFNANRTKLLDQVNYMLDEGGTGGDFLRYFTIDSPDPKNIGEKKLGVPYEPPEDMGLYSPESLRATMERIAKEFSNERNDFRIGGNRELINAEGVFQYHNFMYWVRSKINEDVDYNKDGGINPFGKIIIKLDMGQISMYELLLLIPEYTSQRNFVIKMNDGKENEVFAGWGEKAENPEFRWAEMDYIAAEMEFRQLTHELRTQFTATSISNNKEQYLGLMKKLHHNNHWTRASNVFLMLGLPAGSVKNGKEEVDLWKGDAEKQGSLGKAMSDMLVQYYYLSELTDYNKTYEVDHHGKKIKGSEREKTFNENMFYKFMEPNGANRFLIKMAEGTLNYNSDAKRKYAQFIRQRIEAEYDARYKNASISQDKKNTIIQLMNEWRPDINDASLEVNFRENAQLKNFLTIVENNVLKRNVEEEKIDEWVDESLVKNLRSQYFNSLKKMQVGKVTSKGSNRYMMTNGTIEFGEIDLGKGKKMKDLLDSFDIEQIYTFDYSNDVNDRKNPGYGVTNKDQLRRKIDEFMDKGKNPRNYELFQRNEDLMLAFTKHITRMDRKDINHFRDAEELEFARDLIKRSFRYVAEKNYGINDDESEYGWWWTRDYVYLWGYGAALDCDGIGFRWDGKIMNPGKWRPRRQGKDGGGNAHTFDEFRVFSMPFLHHLQVSNLAEDEELGHRSVFSWLQGGEGGDITPRAFREFDKRSNYSFQQNAEALYVDNTLDASSELIDLLAKTEFDVSNIVSFDVLGNVIFDYAKAREVFGKWRKAARYAFGKNGVDYRAKIWANGSEKTLMEHFFGPKTRMLNELIHKETRGRNPNRDSLRFKDPADAVMMSIVAAEVYEHRQMFSPGHHWTIQNVLELEKFLLDFMTEYKITENDLGEQESRANLGTLFNHKIFATALKAYHTGYHKMYSTEFGSTLGGGLLRGFWAGFKAYWTKGKWVY